MSMCFSRLASAQTGLELFTAEEAKQFRLTDQEWGHTSDRLEFRALALGPRITFKEPKLGGTADGDIVQLRTPAELWVEFEQGSAPVDMDSLEVQARRGIFTKSLTNAFRPYVRGTALRVRDVEVPAGRFLIEISIADVTGTITAETYRLQVDTR